MKTLPALFLASVSLASAATPAFPAFRAVEIDAAVQIGYGVAVADVNGDRRPDVLLADKQQIAWFENPSWKKHVIAEKLTERDNVGLAAADIDGDGRCEIAVGANWNPSDTHHSGALFRLIRPSDPTQRWEAVPLPHEPTAHRFRWVRAGTSGKFDLVAVPLHGRGNNPATGEGVGARTLAYTPPADPRGPWTTALLDDALHKTHNFDPVQWDADAAEEILLAGKEGVFLVDRTANATSGAPTKRQLTNSDGLGAGEVRAGKLANGRRFFATVEPIHGNALVVYMEPATNTASGLWTRHVLDETLVDAHALACGDLAGTGGDQIVVGWRAMNRPGVRVGIKIFSPADATGATWSSTLLDDNGMACEDLCLADLNDDGRLDVVASGRATKNLKIYFNEGVK